jgi:hypothetical protein
MDRTKYEELLRQYNIDEDEIKLALTLFDETDGHITCEPRPEYFEAYEAGDFDRCAELDAEQQ